MEGTMQHGLSLICNGKLSLKWQLHV